MEDSCCCRWISLKKAQPVGTPHKGRTKVWGWRRRRYKPRFTGCNFPCHPTLLRDGRGIWNEVDLEREGRKDFFLCHCFLVLKYVLTNIKLIFPKYSMFLSTKVNEKQSPSLYLELWDFSNCFLPTSFWRKGWFVQTGGHLAIIQSLPSTVFPFCFPFLDCLDWFSILIH